MNPQDGHSEVLHVDGRAHGAVSARRRKDDGGHRQKRKEWRESPEIPGAEFGTCPMDHQVSQLGRQQYEQSAHDARENERND